MQLMQEPNSQTTHTRTGYIFAIHSLSFSEIRDPPENDTPVMVSSAGTSYIMTDSGSNEVFATTLAS